jgi:outer membrane protein TolC
MRSARRALVVLAPLVGVVLAHLVHAQPVPPVGGAPPPAASSAAATTATAPPGTTSVDAALAPTDADAIGVKAGGLTADGAAERAAATSKAVKIDEAKLRAAAALVDQAWDKFLPTLTFKASYTRLSPIDIPSLGLLPVYNGNPNDTPLDINKFKLQPLAFPVYLNSYVLQGSLLIPLSDYAFRVAQNHDAALKGEEAAKWTIQATKQQSRFDARVAYYNWVRAKGSVVVAKAAIADSEGHLKDVKTQLALKAATTADMYRVESQLAAAQLALIQSENLVITTEANLRLLMHAPDDEKVDLGEDVSAELGVAALDLKSLKASALNNRAELKAIDAQIESGEKSASVANAGIFPRLDAIGNVYYARPANRIFPQVDEFRWNWDVTLQLTWSPNDALVANDTKNAVEAQTSELEATREQLVDAINMDVINAYTTVRTAEGSVVAAGAELRAAQEAYRVRIEQFHNGAATSSNVIDAESDLTRARLAELNARVDLRIAKAQLKKAIGE